MKNFIKGIVAGIGSIVPGVSGSALLIILGLYEKCIEAISNIFKNFKKNFLFLLPIAIGIGVGMFAFSNIIKIALEKNVIITTFVFLGLLLGTIPGLFKESCKNGFKKSYIIPFIITFGIGIGLLFLKNNSIFTLEVNIFTLLLIGAITAFATIIPGISNTVLLTMLGVYTIFIDAISTLNIKLLIPVIIGFAITGFALAKLMNILIKKYYGYVFFAIVGFVIATIPALINFKIEFNKTLIIAIILAIISFAISYFISNKADKKSQ